MNSLPVRCGLAVAALLAVVGGAYHAGYSRAALEGEAEKMRIVGEWHKQAAASAQSYIARVKEVQAEREKETARAERLNAALADARRKIDVQTASVEKEIPDVLQKDGGTFSGLGADSLRLYKRALGY